MDQDDHLKLISATALGDRQAFTRLYQQTSGKLLAVCLKMLGNRALAEEAIQDAYVKIWHNAADYQHHKGSVLTWMISIARYRALDILRYQKVRKEDALTAEPAPLEESDDRFADLDAGHKLSQCIDELPQEHQQAIHLAYFNGLSHQEVVHYLDKPLGTIKSWIRRGLQQLQRCLTP
ncbi:sigma-70 family RNA polymerase sigma factor [Photobacterium sp. WH77]|uniref:Sigma-70 family RNA polymerase sigma factor n=1 Tax=Photobacterium arenosum TaxID=2774143 RepID=A0ABR9BKN4_9GAMM|nr:MULTISPECIES: sigma-70 family RNA polymerase sigma factor [Photobacterium]MBD8512212.1 sigma-70 family RNA polymerase sigma factor [Photobacterium arenosum]MBV7263639.1 sigma-70 family RNA polymerase sigma factor [Photobacterium sp. WH24]MCG2836486.1 sigma-70 family RNA polymerase sigma factor [Photobacterium sp. WH77]MCG2843887.1 sigma-70 family RNA polymerase sigma factor [Photobacterium sp. WH80]